MWLKEVSCVKCALEFLLSTFIATLKSNKTDRDSPFCEGSKIGS